MTKTMKAALKMAGFAIAAMLVAGQTAHATQTHATTMTHTTWTQCNVESSQDQYADNPHTVRPGFDVNSCAQSAAQSVHAPSAPAAPQTPAAPQGPTGKVVTVGCNGSDSPNGRGVHIQVPCGILLG